MKTFIGLYDLQRPITRLWGVNGYSRAVILVRAGSSFLGFLSLEHDPDKSTLAQHQIVHAIERDLNIHPQLQRRYPSFQSVYESTQPEISVIVCTRDRPHSLRRCLRALEKLDYQNHEVIVVDNASYTEETAQVVAATSFLYVREEQPGLDWARNRGIKEARYDIVAYVDDDAQVDSGWLKGIAAGFAHPDIAAVTGLILPAELETRAQHLFELYGGMSKGFSARIFKPEEMTPRQLIKTQEIGVGANMAFRRHFLRRLEGFDTGLDVGTPSGGVGDLDMLHRILLAGGTICYEPRALMWHQHRRSIAGLRQQLYNNGQSYGVYLIKRWKEKRLDRRQVLHYTGFWGYWLVGRLLSGLFKRQQLPLSLLWAEFWGALNAPRAYVQTYRHDRWARQKLEPRKRNVPIK
jgi:glycosyltransferase involved in cell wall biosynthesis